ncbi:MAG: PEGA domain-containing protein, partial [Methanomicrobiales archaeon]|nr:PEGA domain-containing protein [Methanomicrobiales archaeon]
VLPTQAPGGAQIAKNHSGGLYIDSYPPDMTIILDNKKQIWKTPRVIYGLREGLHTINIEESDPSGKKEESSYRFEPRQAWVYPDAIAPVSLDGLTTRRWKTIRIDSEAYVGAKFTVNGFYPAGTIPGDAEVEGTKSWVTVLWKETYRSHAISPRVESGETCMIEPGGENLVSISIRSSPEGAGVFVDGFPTGKVTPCRVDGLSPGQHRILVSKPGYLPAEEVISIPEGARTGGTITCTLREYVSGDLLIESTIPDAKIYLYGRYTGEKVPHTFSGMSIGTYDVRVVSEGDSKTIWDVLVTPGETTIYRVVLKE